MAKKNLDSKGMREAMVAALNPPRVDPFAGLVLGLTASGAKIVPPDLWDELAEALKASGPYDEGGDGEVGQFCIHNNHNRSEAHEVWQPDFVSDLLEKAGRKTVWIVPADELTCMAYGDEFACDFVSLTRLSFVGTEKQMRSAVKDLVRELQVSAVQEA